MAGYKADADEVFEVEFGGICGFDVAESRWRVEFVDGYIRAESGVMPGSVENRMCEWGDRAKDGVM